MIREGLSRLFTFEERHRRLLARVLIALGASAVVFIIGTLLVWMTESGQKGGAIHGLGDAAFFTAVQLLTVSSSLGCVLPIRRFVLATVRMRQVRVPGYGCWRCPVVVGWSNTPAAKALGDRAPPRILDR